MEPFPVKLPPGFFRNGTEYESAGRYYDGNQVRWVNDRVRPFGGWRRVLAGSSVLTGIARGILPWRSNIGYRYMAIGTNSKLYVGSNGAYADLTPLDLVAGREHTIAGPGYGAGPYGAESYGTPRAENAVVLDAATWSFDTFGENLQAVLTSDGRLLEWSPTDVGDPAAVAGAPVDNTAVMVTDEEHVMLLGIGGNKRKVGWCSQGDNTDWVASDLNTAGSRVLQTPGNIVTGRRVGAQNIVFTTSDVHAMDYLGPPYVYKNRYVGDGGIFGPNAAAVKGAEAYWMGPEGFFKYDGSVQPLPCDVLDYVFGDINLFQRTKVAAGVNSQFHEIIWNYPSAASLENDRYVALNYVTKRWYFGRWARTCWADRGVFAQPIAVDPSGVVFEHEVGMLGDGASRAADIFLQSGPAEIGNGKNLIYSTLLIPDIETGAAAITLTVKTRNAPQGPLTTAGPYSLVANAEGYVPIRVAGRQAALRYQQILDTDWSVGTQRFLSSIGGQR